MRAAVLALAALLACGAAGAEETCPTATPPPVGLPHSTEALRHDGRLLIVALGSSTTQSYMASDSSRSYPVLQAKLGELLPKAHVAVINRGIGGQDAAEELARLDADAIAVRPSLVIWQLGANAAMRRMNPETFKRLLTEGVKRLQAAKIDVVLMDNQRAPRIMAVPEHIGFGQALADVAAGTGASLFSRASLMDEWQRAGRPYKEFISGDDLHHNDLGYRCLAYALADSVAAGLNQPVVSPPCRRRA